MEIKKRKDFIHHRKSKISAGIREIVFGMEDGMVSTLGAMTGIAVGVGDSFVAILSGLVIISVESISMAIGSYLSNKSVIEVDKRKLYEEGIELKETPEEEKRELVEMYLDDGWPLELARQMVDTAFKDKKLFIKEMAHHELGIIPDKIDNPVRGGVYMFFSYVIGGLIPLIPYFILPIKTSIFVSIVSTMLGLFLLGVITVRFTKRSWWKSGAEMFGLAGLATVVGYIIGRLADIII